MKLYFITGNENKFKEAKTFVSDIEKLSLDLAEVQSLDPHEIIKFKLNEAKKLHSGDFIVEDTSLNIECLNGMPGTLIKWFEKSIGLNGIVKMTDNYNNKNATAKCVIGLSLNNEIRFFEGSINGRIVESRGENGFGWDKIFIPNGYEKTFAEMNYEEKNNISHRKLAFEKLKEYFDETKLRVIYLNSSLDKINYSKFGDAGIDLRASGNFVVDLDSEKKEIKQDEYEIKPNERILIKTGIKIAIPPCHYGSIRDRSGLALKYGLHTLGGVIDENYREELCVILINLGKNNYKITKNERIAQMIISKYETKNIEDTNSLNETSRTGGFGSSGKH